MLRTLKSLVPENLKTRMKKLLRRRHLSHSKVLGREQLSHLYLKGKGIEIGALHNPLYVSKAAKVQYVDRLSVEDLKRHYPELSKLPLVHVDIIDNGEELGTIKDRSQDFVIANHFIEHCQNPLRTLSNMFRVLKKGGVLYIALPDKRYTFDIDRPVTPLEHILKDYREGPENSKRQHFEEWVRLVNKIHQPADAQKEVERLLKIDYSIHFHVWTQSEMLEMFLALKNQLGLSFDIETCLKNEHEFILILRKTD
ncbi:class I SAM-dependent methyltransferase [Candidatus Protochlamydia phocaeensis]|uniref:class I SAM-dependent methyltransferase n=1 Tax=Candidatus Protochlamydia phocaeensis TaxID=1414722 RepID=UPI000A91FC4D|nr:methyltransferase domain-containing protein [Candidatus Protochlamydia phocaeensis]